MCEEGAPLYLLPAPELSSVCVVRGGVTPLISTSSFCIGRNVHNRLSYLLPDREIGGSRGSNSHEGGLERLLIQILTHYNNMSGLF